jgi:hypothetical protein
MPEKKNPKEDNGLEFERLSDSEMSSSEKAAERSSALSSTQTHIVNNIIEYILYEIKF